MRPFELAPRIAQLEQPSDTAATHARAAQLPHRQDGVRMLGQQAHRLRCRRRRRAAIVATTTRAAEEARLGVGERGTSASRVPVEAYAVGALLEGRRHSEKEAPASWNERSFAHACEKVCEGVRRCVKV